MNCINTYYTVHSSFLGGGMKIESIKKAPNSYLDGQLTVGKGKAKPDLNYRFHINKFPKPTGYRKRP